MTKHMNRPFVLRISGCILLAVLTGFQMFAQPGQHETVTVIGTYTPQLSEARKIGFSPEIKDSVIPVPKIEYRIVSSPVEVVPELKPVPPAKMTGETFQKLYKNHIIAGMGNYWSPYLDFSHHSYRNKKFRGDIHLRHLSASGELKDYPFPGYSENSAGLTAHYMIDNYTFTSGIDYKRDGIHYFGFLMDSAATNFGKKDIRQVFNKLDFFITGASNYQQKDKFHHDFRLKYQGLWDSYEVSEQNILFGGNIKKQLSLVSFLENEMIAAEIDGGFFSHNQDTVAGVSDGLIRFKPYLSASLDALEIKLGGNVCFKLDSVGEIFLLPYGRLDLHIVPGYLNIFIGVDGGFEKNTFRRLSEINPFIHTSVITPDYTTTRNELSGGVNGGFGGKFNYRLMARNRSIKNMPLFVNDTLAVFRDSVPIVYGNRFDVVYDNVDILTLSMELQMKFTKKITADFRAAYNIFSPETQERAWHQPQYEGNLGIVYNLDDKIIGRFNLFAFGNRYAFSNNTEYKLKPVYDFNIEAEYRFNKQLGFWARFNNFTTKRHFYWYNYPTQRLNFMAGVSYTF